MTNEPELAHAHAEAINNYNLLLSLKETIKRYHKGYDSKEECGSELICDLNEWEGWKEV